MRDGDGAVSLRTALGCCDMPPVDEEDREDGAWELSHGGFLSASPKIGI